MSNSQPHCSVDYHEFNGADLDTKAQLISTGVYSNDPPFTLPPVATKILFDGVITAFHDAYDAYKNGGKAQKGAYMTTRTTLIDQLDITGEYIDKLPGVNEDMIVLGGYTPTKTGDTKAVIPGVPTGVKLDNSVKGSIAGQCGAVQRATFYGGIMVAGAPLPVGFTVSNGGQIIIPSDQSAAAALTPGSPMLIFDLNKSRRKLFTGLVKGVEYFFYFYAGNTAGVSQLSAFESILCE